MFDLMIFFGEKLSKIGKCVVPFMISLLLLREGGLLAFRTAKFCLLSAKTEEGLLRKFSVCITFRFY